MATHDHAQILRFSTRSTLDAALLGHVEGRFRPTTATPMDTPATVLRSDLDGARAAIRRGRELGGRGRRRESVDVLVAGPPRWTADDAWSDRRIRRWAEDSIAWIERTYPTARIALAAIHHDEASPHLHVELVPTTEDGRLSWAECCRKAFGDKRAYRQAQDDYQRRIGRRYGLDRGEVGSRARWERPDIAEATEAAIDRARAAGREDATRDLAEREQALERRTRDLDRREELVFEREGRIEDAGRRLVTLAKKHSQT